MKHLWLFLSTVLIILSMTMNCDILNGTTVTVTDTIYQVVDTIEQIDTIYKTDTTLLKIYDVIFKYDTIIDTIIFVDTTKGNFIDTILIKIDTTITINIIDTIIITDTINQNDTLCYAILRKRLLL